MADDLNATMKSFLEHMDGLKARVAEIEAENKQLENDLEKARSNRDAILREKRALEGRQAPSAPQATATEIFMTKTEASDPRRYVEMREKAEAEGKRLRIVDDTRKGTPTASPVDYLECEESGTLFVNSKISERVGIMRLQELAREKGFKRAQVFRSSSDLPRHLQQAHAQAERG